MRTTPNTLHAVPLPLLSPLLSVATVLLGLASAPSDAHAQRRPRASGKKPPPAAVSEPSPAPDGAAAADAAAAAPRGDEPSATPGTEAGAPATPAQGTPGASGPVPATTPTDAASVPAPGTPVDAAGTAGAAESAPPPQTPPASGITKDVAGVMDELVQLRTRARVLGKALFKTKVRIKVENEAAPDQIAVRLQLWLDGAPVWSGDGTGLRDSERALFEGLAAPGPHVLTYEVEQRARDDEKYRYTQRASLRFSALRERRTDLTLVLEDDSDMAEDFEEDEEGEYDVRVRLQVSAEELDE